MENDKPWHMGTHLNISINTNMTEFKWLQKSLCPCLLDESSLSIIEGLYSTLTLMLLVDNLAPQKRNKKTLKMTETLANGYSFESTQRELSNEY